jgi:hypothetical protein
VTVRPRFRIALAAAVAAHAWLAWELRPRATAGLPPTAPMEAVIEVEAPPIEEPVAVAEAPVEPVRSGTIAREHAGSASPASTAHVEPSASSSAEVPSPAPPLAASDEGSWTFSPTKAAPGGSAIPLGLTHGGESGIREAQAEDEKRATARAPDIHFTPQDFALGLVPGGRFVTMARDDVRRSLVPDISRALLEFDTNREGIVVTVRVLDVTSDRVSWEDVAAALRTEIGTGRPERVPAGANGVAIVIEVTSTLKTASGTKPTSGAFESIVRAVNNPIDVALEGAQATHRDVAARVVDVRTL